MEFFDVAGLHIQVPCITSLFTMTAITQYTDPMQLMLESKEGNVLSMPLKSCASQTVFNSAVTYVHTYQTTGHLQWFNTFVMLKTVVNICTYVRHNVDMLYCND